MPATKKPLTKAQRIKRENAIIKDLRSAKLSYRQIALKHKVSLPTVNAKARKAGITRTRRGVATTKRVVKKKTATMRTRKATARKKVTRKVAKKKVVRRTTTRRVTSRATSALKFQAQFKDLVMNYYPNMSLKAYEKLTKTLTKALP